MDEIDEVDEMDRWIEREQERAENTMHEDNTLLCPNRDRCPHVYIISDVLSTVVISQIVAIRPFLLAPNYKRPFH